MRPAYGLALDDRASVLSDVGEGELYTVRDVKTRAPLGLLLLLWTEAYADCPIAQFLPVPNPPEHDDRLLAFASELAAELRGERVAVIRGSHPWAAIISREANGYCWHSCRHDRRRWQSVQGHYLYESEQQARAEARAYLDVRMS